MADTAAGMSIDAQEPIREGTDESLDASTPDAETEIPPEIVGQQKRKGGRKPVCWQEILTMQGLFANAIL